jgi:hypothetical protein
MILAVRQSLVDFQRVLLMDFTRRHPQFFHDAVLPALQFIFI